MNKYEQLKQKIIEAVPEILELKFGCEVQNEKTKVIGQIVDYIDGQWIMYHRGSGKAPNLYYFNNDDKNNKIIGRHIRLEDILLAIQKQEKDNKNKWTNKSQIGLLEESIKLLFTDKIKWDLTKDLDNQSDETKQFLQDILL